MTPATLPCLTTQTNTKYVLLPLRFLELNRGEVLLVNDLGEYTFLPNDVFHRFVDRQLDNTSPHYKELESLHFLTTSLTKGFLDRWSVRYKTRKMFLAGFTKLHILVVTLRCNHSCHYCQVSRQSQDKMKYDMSQETASRAVELIFNTPAPAITVEFQGGEPLLNVDVVKFIVERAETLSERFGKRIDFVICTNLAPLTDEMLSFCKDHRVSISTSLDGPEFIHNANRPNRGRDSYQVTIANIKRAREALGNNRVAALMTTTRLSLDYPCEIVDEYVRQGFRSIFLRALNPYGFAIRSLNHIGHTTSRFLDFYKLGLDHIISLNRQGVDIVECYAKIILTKVLTPFSPGFVDLQSPAGIGINVAVYNYDGNVYASDEARMLAEMGDSMFRLGNVHSDSYKEIFGGERLRHLMAASCNETLPGCSDCVFQPYCGADPVRHYATQGDIFGHRPTSEYCEKNMGIFKYLFEKLRTGDETLQRIFLAWIRDDSVANITAAAPRKAT